MVGKPFQKGQSGNPSGRPKADKEVRDLARKHTPAAIDRLVYWLKSKNASASVRAAEVILDRGWGKATQPLTGEDGAELFRAVEVHIVDHRSSTDSR